MQVISLNIPKSAKVYNRSLSSLLSTPDSLQQHSAVRAPYEFNYLEERCRKCSRKVTFVVRNQSGSISTVTLTLRIVSIQFEPRSDFRSCCLIVRGRVVSKRTVVYNAYVKVTDVWTTSGIAGGKSHETCYNEANKSLRVSWVTFFHSLSA